MLTTKAEREPKNRVIQIRVTEQEKDFIKAAAAAAAMSVTDFIISSINQFIAREMEQK